MAGPGASHETGEQLSSMTGPFGLPVGASG